MSWQDAIRASIEALHKSIRETKDPDKVIALSDRLMTAVEKLGGDNDLEPLWDVEQAAQFLGIQPDTVRKWCSMQKIPYIPVGGTRRFDPQSLKKWALSNEVKPHSVWKKSA